MFHFTTKVAEPKCACTWEAGDSPCPAHDRDPVTRKITCGFCGIRTADNPRSCCPDGCAEDQSKGEEP